MKGSSPSQSGMATPIPESLRLFDKMVPTEVRDRLGGQLDELVRQDAALLMVDPAADVPDPVDRENGQMIAIDVDADREAAVGIDLEFDRGLPAQATPTPRLQDQALIKQPIDDACDPRLRQARLPRKVRAGDRGVAMDLAQNERAIVLARLLRIRAGQVDRGPRRGKNALHQPFTAPAVIALRIKRWRSRKTTIAGRTEMRQAAASSCVEVELSKP